MSGERGAADAARAAEQLLDGRAWAAFCDALRDAGRHVLDPPLPGPDAHRLRAEGFAYLLGLVYSATGQALRLADPDFPSWLRNPESVAKWGAENADNQYLWAPIRPEASYRIQGERGTAFDFLVELKEGYMQLGHARNFATLASGELTLEPDGSFELRLGGEPSPGNWLPIHPDARYVCIRQYFWDWSAESPARFSITRIGAEGEAPGPVEPAAVARRLADAGRWVETSARFWNEWPEQLRRDHQPGRLAPARRFVGGADDIRYGNDHYRLGGDEALVIESEVPRARYWSFQLCDPWFRSLDYANHQTSLNGHQAHLDPDGRVRCVVAHRDPQVPNWLDTLGHREGVLQYRWIWSQDDPRPRVRTLPLADVRDALHPDTPVTTPAQRRAAIAVRQAHVARREPAT